MQKGGRSVFVCRVHMDAVFLEQDLDELEAAVPCGSQEQVLSAAHADLSFSQDARWRELRLLLITVTKRADVGSMSTRAAAAQTNEVAGR